MKSNTQQKISPFGQVIQILEEKKMIRKGTDEHTKKRIRKIKGKDKRGKKRKVWKKSFERKVGHHPYQTAMPSSAVPLLHMVISIKQYVSH